MDKSESDDKLK